MIPAICLVCGVGLLASEEDLALMGGAGIGMLVVVERILPNVLLFPAPGVTGDWGNMKEDGAFGEGEKT